MLRSSLPALPVPATSIADNLAVSARRYPQRTAIDFFGRAISYAQLQQRVDRLAGHLRRACGLQPGDRVLLDLQNSPAFVVAYYAVLRADAIVVPVNPMNMVEELRWIAADSGARVAIVAQDLLAQIEPLRGEGLLRHVLVACYGDDLPEGETDIPPPDWLRAPALPLRGTGLQSWADALRADPADTPPRRGGEDIAVLAYTSGTTGQPKGCMLSHRALQAGIAGLAAWNGWHAGAVVLATAPFFHVTGMNGSLNLPILAGAGVLPLPRWDRAAAATLIERRRVTHWTNVPTMVADLLALPGVEQRDFSSLVHMGGGGTAMPAAVAARLHALTGLAYQEGWGMTEVAGAILLNPPGAERLGSVGVPMPGVDTHVIDPDSGAELPPGADGEWVTHAPSLFSGYWNDPAADEQAHLSIGGRRYLRTGDIGHVDGQGYFHLADRLKRMINASGFKVWPAEVESLLYGHPDILEACVVGVPDAHRGETVKAFVVLRDPARAPRPEEIVEWSRRHMAAYKIPRFVEIVPGLPHSGSGKLLWRVLQERERKVPPGMQASP